MRRILSMKESWQTIPQWGYAGWRPATRASAHPDDAAPRAFGDRCTAIVDVQLRQDVLDVDSCRLVADAQYGGDFLVAQTLRYERQHLDFSRRQVWARCALRETFFEVRSHGRDLSAVDVADD